MPALKLRRIDLSANTAAAQIVKLRDQFRIDSEVVSPASKKLTQAVFRQALTPEQAVERICEDVRDKGLSAVLSYTEQLDKVKLKPEMLRVKPEELAAAHSAASPEFLDVIRQVQYNVLQFQSGLMHRDAEMRVSTRHELLSALSPDGSRRRLLPRRRGGLSVDAADDGLPRAGRGCRADCRVHAAEGYRRVQP